MLVSWKRSGSRRRAHRRLLLSVLGVLGAIAVLWFVPTPYYVTAPGAAIDASRVVQAEGGTVHRGRLYMLVVTSRPANLFWYLYSRIDRRVELQQADEFLGDIPDYEQYQTVTRRMMENSQQTAKALSLQWLGYGTGVRQVGAEVVSLVADSPAAAYLQPGDRIVALDGECVTSAAELRQRLQEVEPGSLVEVRFQRGDAEWSVQMSTIRPQDADLPGRALLGVYIVDALEFDIPLSVQIRSGSITGPSAGLIFALEIVDQLSATDLTGGRKVAGTGTVEADGTIGAIGAVRQKVYTAEAAGAEVMLVPQDNYEEALSAASRIRIVPVSTLQEALQYLATFAAAGPA